MFFKNFQALFLISLILGTFIAISANSWFTCWLGLELNLISFIPVILRYTNIKSTESAIKYFLAQAISSIILIASSNVFSFIDNNSLILNPSNLIIIALIIKIGVAPTHFWFPQVITNLNWFQCFIIIVWQKIAPIFIFSYFAPNHIISSIIVLSALTGAAGGINQSFIKPLLAFSSISHSAWIISLSTISAYFILNYLIIYAIINIALTFFLNTFDINSISSTFNNIISTPIKINIIILIMSLGGLPPFIGFAAKINALMTLINFNFFFTPLILILSSIVSLYFYFKINYRFIFNKNSALRLNLSTPSKNKFITKVLSSISLRGNLILPLLIILAS